MSEITNLNVKLQNNPYAGYILPVIAYFNDPTLRTINPFEAVAVANILNNRVRNWNNGGSSQPVYGIGVDKCCCPALTTSGRDCTWCARNPATTGTCCPTCEDEPALSAARLGSPPQFSVPEFLELASADQNLDSPYTPVVRKFETELDGMIMDQTNSWIFMQQMIDVFYENVDVTSPFRIVYGGEYLDVINFIIGGDVRDGFEETGLVVSTISDGATGDTKATTRITATGTGFAEGVLQPGPYVDFFVSPTDRRVIWFSISPTSYFQPTVTPIGGEVITYHEIALAQGLPAADSALTIQSTIDGFAIPGVDPVAVEGTNVVAISLTATGPAPGPTGGTLGGLMTGFNPGWGFTFTDGTSGTAANESTNIDFYYANPARLIGRWFKMYNGTEAHLYFYQEAGIPIDPASFSTSYDFAHPIVIDADRYKTQLATDAAIVATGLWSVGLREKCCECIGCDNEGNPCCGDCCACPGNSCGTVATLIAAVPSTDSEGGTSAAGPLNQVNNLVAPDGYDFGGDYKDDRDYANAWNTLVVQRMIEQGSPTHYLKPVSYKGNPCGGVCCCEDTNCTSRGCECRQCGDGGDTTYQFGSIMLQTTHLSVTEDLPFNTPGSNFGITAKDACPSCLI